MVSVLIFAHNEQDNLANCVASVQAGGLGADDVIWISANGCTDGTVQIAQKLALSDHRVQVRNLDKGDKSNAWNDYVFNLADLTHQVHVFMDGDVTMTAGALTAMVRALQSHPDALAAAATPRQGRTAPQWAARIIREHGLPGNLYALRASTLARIRAARLWLPVGLIGDDSFLLWLLRRDLDAANPPRRALIQPAPEAGFVYQSFPLWSLAGIRALFRRQRTYALRDLQVLLLQDHCKATGMTAMPRHINALYGKAPVWAQLFAPNGPRPLRLRQLFFVWSWWRTRRPDIRSGPPIWDER